MIPIINKDNSNLKINWNYKYINAVESNTYEASYNGKPAITKFFINEDCIKNKVQKMKLIKERCKDINFVVTADAFIEENGKIIGYVMPKIDGINVYDSTLPKVNKPAFLIWYLKELSSNLKKLHNLGIINGDFISNVLVKDEKLFFIDHDNFCIDNFNIDKQNKFLMTYLEKRKTVDKNFDFYLLNLYTFSLIRRYHLPYIYSTYEYSPEIFNFRDNEVRELFEKTITLDESFNGELIIDKINSKKDLKKIKSRIF